MSLVSTAVAQLQSGSYTIDAVDVNSGAERSTSESYTLIASTGQHGGTGFISSAAYSLTDGVWPVAIAMTTVVFVDADAMGADDGSSWEDAFTSLQDALDVAASQIWVAAGTYKPDDGINQTPGAREATFQLINGVALYGGFVGDETALSERPPDPDPFTIDPTTDSILSGDLDMDEDLDVLGPPDTDNSFHVVTGSGTDASAVIDGFTIARGVATDPIVTPHHLGGGILNWVPAGSPTVRNCIIAFNRATAAGGMYNNEGSNPSITSCIFWNNIAVTEGGGLYNNNSSPMVSACLFKDNSTDAPQGGGASFNRANSNPTFIDCEFMANVANSGANGGGMLNDNSSPTLFNCLFRYNVATSGGAVANWNGSDCEIINCLYVANRAGPLAGAVRLRKLITVSLRP